MKLMIALLAGLVTLSACSKGSNGGAGGGGPEPVTPFEKAVSGSEWTSDCQRNQRGAFREKLTLSPGGSGSSALTYFQNQDCTGQTLLTEGPFGFTYIASQPAIQGGPTQVTVNMSGKGPMNLVVFVNGDTMTVQQTPGPTITYTRPSVGQVAGPISQDPANPNPANPNPAPEDPNSQNSTPGTPTPSQVGGRAGFERFAVGQWISKECYQGESANETMKLVFTISSGGSGSYVQRVFRSSSCLGQAKTQSPHAFKYAVDQFSGQASVGDGLITIDGQAVVDVSFANGEMTMRDSQGSSTYSRLR